MNPDHHETSAGFRFSGGMPDMFMDRGPTRTGSGELAGVDAKPLKSDKWLARVVYTAAVSAVTWLLRKVHGGWWVR